MLKPANPPTMTNVPSPPNKLLTPEQVRGYAEDGILFPVPVFPPSLAPYFQEVLRQLEQRGGGRQKYTALPHLFFRRLWELALSPRLLDAAEDLIGPELIIDSTLLLCKYPGDSAFAPWHQDGIHSGWYKTPSVSAWIALADSTSANGCMRVIPGSHRGGRLVHEEVAREDSLFGPGPEIEVEVDASQAVDVTLTAGEASFHHSSIVHGSPPNRSEQRRICLIVRFVTPLFQPQNPNIPVVRARGNADVRHMKLMEAPPCGEFDECFAHWQAFASQPRRGRSLDGMSAATK
jgi:hypothetical protein